MYFLQKKTAVFLNFDFEPRNARKRPWVKKQGDKTGWRVGGSWI
jgi:hypothetical protein